MFDLTYITLPNSYRLFLSIQVNSFTVNRRMILKPEQHYRRSIRLRWYDYSHPGVYFVTLCIHDRTQRLFGNVVAGKMVLNSAGEYAQKCWMDISIHYSQIKLDEFVVMPNHIHGIIVIRDCVGAGLSRPSFPPVKTMASRLKSNGASIKTGRDDRAPTLGTMVAFFKYQSTKRINAKRQSGIQKTWQRNYFEHIVRNEKSLFAIRRYIKDNPLNWASDEENPFGRPPRYVALPNPQWYY